MTTNQVPTTSTGTKIRNPKPATMPATIHIISSTCHLHLLSVGPSRLNCRVPTGWNRFHLGSRCLFRLTMMPGNVNSSSVDLSGLTLPWLSVSPLTSPAGIDPVRASAYRAPPPAFRHRPPKERLWSEVQNRRIQRLHVLRGVLSSSETCRPVAPARGEKSIFAACERSSGVEAAETGESHAQERMRKRAR
jgi:hypothetical protein